MKLNKPVWPAAAIALLASGSWLIMREANTGTISGQETRPTAVSNTVESRPKPVPISAPQHSDSTKLVTPRQVTDLSASRVADCAPPAPVASLPPDGSPSSARRGPDRFRPAIGATTAVETPADLPTPATTPPAGLRLAPDVRLPAAALPLEFKMTPVAAKALENIIEDYYRDLATGLAPELDAAASDREDGADGSMVETEENGEKTVVVTNGKVAEQARKQADARFRALFGNAHFNRITIQSALESRLPADAGN